MVYGHDKTCVIPTNMYYSVLCSRPDIFYKKKLSPVVIANYITKRHKLACYQACIHANWAVGDVCQVLGSELNSCRPKLLTTSRLLQTKLEATSKVSLSDLQKCVCFYAVISLKTQSFGCNIQMNQLVPGQTFFYLPST